MTSRTDILLSAVDNALRNGSYMTGANYAFMLLCDDLGVDRDSLPPFNPQWSQALPDVVGTVAPGDFKTTGRSGDRCLNCNNPIDGHPPRCAPPQPAQVVDVVHLIQDGSATTSCCYRAPFELARADRLTVDPDAVTCGVAQREGSHV